MVSKEITVHISNISLFNERFSEIEKKFAKKNLPAIKAECIQVPQNKDDEYFKFIISSDFNQSNLKGINVNFEGVVSLIDQNENDKIFSFDNIKIPALLQNCECDECHKKIGRNKYIVFSKAGKEVESREDLIVLGTTCSTNYFPFSIESYLGQLEYALDSLDEYDENCRGGSSYISNSTDTLEFFQAVCCVSDNFKVYEKEGGTKGNALRWIHNDKIYKNGPTYREYYPTPANAIEFNGMMKDWIVESFDKDDIISDFDMNARSTFFRTLDDGTRVFRERIPNKFLGIAAYGFFAAKKNHEKLIEKQAADEQRAKDNAQIEFFGEVGTKFEKELTFDKCFGFEGAYGFQYIHIFKDDENHVFKWSTSNGTYHCWCNTNGREGYCEYETGKKYLIKGTIKAHNEYKGVKQTVITRCEVLKDECETHTFDKKEAAKIRDEIAAKREAMRGSDTSDDPFEALMEAIA